ncbi:unnamed protein product [Lupinus luteus]|uniref:Uncharacterized protein n=1 Tax=Lupinus luteus TaxID=3873 RepID=A0AAV1XAM3_LUPLU
MHGRMLIEEPLVLGEAVGTKSRGLSTDIIASLPSVNYKIVGDQHGSNDSCVICRMDYEGGESLTVLTPTLRMTLWLMGATLGCKYCSFWIQFNTC